MAVFKFQLRIEMASDNKTNIACVKTIQKLDDDEVYEFPPSLQNLAQHEILKKKLAVVNVVKQLKRNQYRYIKIAFNDDEKKEYEDDTGNIVFKDNFLQETIRKSAGTSVQDIVNATTKPKPLSTLLKDIVIEKFVNKKQNATLWIATFEKECLRLGIEKERFSEALRLVIDGPVTDWYSLNIKQLTLEEDWETWHASFLEAYADRGWKDVMYALEYKYSFGSLIDFAIKKINLLVETEPTISEASRINLTVASLPNFVRNRLSKKEVTSQKKLITELTNLESLIQKNSTSPLTKNENPKPEQQKKSNDRSSPSQKPTSQRKPCSFCEKEGKSNMFHPETKCWYNPTSGIEKPTWLVEKGKVKSGNVKLTNNNELETLINENADSKN